MTTVVSNPSGDHHDKIANAAIVLGRSKTRKEVFKAIYQGKKKIKKVSDIEVATGMSKVRVSQEASRLHAADIVRKTKSDKELAYEKIDFYTHNKAQILRLSNNKEKLGKYPTKVNPKLNSKQFVTIRVPKFAKPKVELITIDEVDSFSRVKNKSANLSLAKMPEAKFKHGLLNILNEKGKPDKDWGGETNDIFTNRLLMGGRRYHAAFALKGPGKNVSKLTQKDMGKNGDQISRLYRSSAQVFFVQYWRQIDQGVLDLMNQLGIGKSYSEGRPIYVGLIDGGDSSRIIQAYPKAFKKKRK